MLSKTITLNNGVTMPIIGSGTWPLLGNECTQTVTTAIEQGFRLIDTAARYGNEQAVGKGIKQSKVAREELFITSKLRGSAHGYQKTIDAFYQTLKDLQLDYLDLYLIHWPLPSQNLYVETWKAFITLYNKGLIKAIGVSNFKIAHLSRIIDETGIIPAVNQIQLSPYLPQQETRLWMAKYNIVCQAWSPLGRGTDLLNTSIITNIAAKHNKMPAQIVLRWHLQLGNSIIPKSSHPKRMQQNLNIFDFELDKEDMVLISTLDKHIKPKQDPDTYTEE
ncbi:aldo/keto reductase [Entomomonas asaccharolytica]|uniref:Aldo/keto reductase n=1 Tax=Entomomonas asaccharolytica TaxID=2785331 RepID=A0A974NFX3_9GAMM|nr:aldo/keto reductase [Entomomonas asaccharolytica]QQP85933.1 aldo/keto reductase [Entomomonas asaccharolytica]